MSHRYVIVIHGQSVVLIDCVYYMENDVTVRQAVTYSVINLRQTMPGFGETGPEANPNQTETYPASERGLPSTRTSMPTLRSTS